MNKSSEEYRQFIEKYHEFIEEYDKFLKQYAHSSQLTTAMKTSIQQNTPVTLSYENAVHGHIEATKAYLKAVTIYKQLVQKWLLIAKSCYKGKFSDRFEHHFRNE
jgi:tryptophan synthase beta subunit